MTDKKIAQYIHTLFEESRDGWLTIGIDQERFDYKVEWEESQAEDLALRCQRLVELLTTLAPMQDRLTQGTRHLTREQMEIWHIYLRPFPEHDMDKEALRAIWEKETIGQPLSKEERMLSNRYSAWYQEQALKRLPWEKRDPADLICRAKRYARLVQLNAPVAVREHEARCLAEEFVLYHCMKL